ncbi:hypothetical protein [Inquilinus limosus]|uniref:hypothetical protein n=1 Tax=Inquilinus limosus TaxID=171674 RepID=UPI000421C44D|nr:hypothetical protein [Inquilinus limosus]
MAQIAATFGLTEVMVKQRLALGNLLPRLRDLYRRQEIDAETIRHLTIASKARQREWLALYDDPKQWAPTGIQAKRWILGGQAIPVSAALFPPDEYPGKILSDLFREERYFADPEAFWPLQNAAIAAKCEALLAAGWAGVEVLEAGKPFAEWEHERVPKAKGGNVFVTVSHQGEVELHEGWVSRKEARKLRPKQDSGRPEPAARPEDSRALKRYLDLHRHAAVPGGAARPSGHGAAAAAGACHRALGPLAGRARGPGGAQRSRRRKPCQQHLGGGVRRRAPGSAGAARPRRGRGARRWALCR